MPRPAIRRCTEYAVFCPKSSVSLSLFGGSPVLLPCQRRSSTGQGRLVGVCTRLRSEQRLAAIGRVAGFEVILRF